jgi:hypothetical protein
MSQFDWPIAKKKRVETHKIEDSMERWSAPSLWPRYVGEKGRTLGKTYGIKVGYYWEHLWRTDWEPREHIKNLKGTYWEQRK